MRTPTDEEQQRWLRGLRYLLQEHAPETEAEVGGFLRSEGLDGVEVGRRGATVARIALEKARAIISLIKR